MLYQVAQKNYQSSRHIERDQLVLQHLGLVRHVLGRLIADLPPHVDLENLEGAGLLGLVEAAARFDPARSVDFAHYATRRVRGAILDELRRNCPLPQQQLQLWAEIRELTANCEVYPSTAEIAGKLGTTEVMIADCLEAVRLLRHEEWCDELMPRHEKSLESSSVERQELCQALSEAIVQLPDRLRAIVSMYYVDELRLKEIGEVLELSESRVSRLLTEAQLRLKRILSQHRRGEGLET